jgi:hypothetical protein
MALKRLSLTRGDSKTYTLIFKAGIAGTAYVLHNCVVFFTLKSNPALPDYQASLQIINGTAGEVAAGTFGTAYISLARNDTINLAVGEYDFDFKLLTESSKTYTVMKGKFNLEQNVTGTAGTAGA